MPTGWLSPYGKLIGFCAAEHVVKILYPSELQGFILGENVLYKHGWARIENQRGMYNICWLIHLTKAQREFLSRYFELNHIVINIHPGSQLDWEREMEFIYTQ